MYREAKDIEGQKLGGLMIYFDIEERTGLRQPRAEPFNLTRGRPRSSIEILRLNIMTMMEKCVVTQSISPIYRYQ